MKRIAMLCLFALTPLVSSANIIPTNTAVTGAGNYLWSYQFSLSSDQDALTGLSPAGNPVPHADLRFGAFVTIYDFAGYVAGSCQGPAGWACTAQNVGFTPDDVLPTDDPRITNLTWARTSGPTLSGQPLGLDLGIFSARSAFNQRAFVSYASRGLKNNGPSTGSIADNVGTTAGPRSVPEPGSLALAGLGLALLSRALVKKR